MSIIDVPFNFTTGLPDVPEDIKIRVRNGEQITIRIINVGSGFVKNALRWGVAGLNIDGGRVGTEDNDRFGGGTKGSSGFCGDHYEHDGWRPGSPAGRWPANLVLDGSDEVTALFPVTGKSNMRPPTGKPKYTGSDQDSNAMRGSSTLDTTLRGHNDNGGSAARFFYCASQDELDLFFCRAKDIMGALNITIGGEQCNPRNASIAESNLSLSNQAAVSVLNDAVILVSRGETRLSALKGLSTNVTASELETLLTSLITAILSIESDVLREPQPGRPIQNGSLVSIAETQKPTGTTTITISHWKSAGFAEPVTLSITPLNMAAGEADSVSRIKYCAKASRAERNAGCEGMELTVTHSAYGDYAGTPEHASNVGAPRVNGHPTVKPLALMRYLAKLTRTPTGGVVLDPFMGSGTTGMAAVMEGRDFIGIELEPEYFEIATARIQYAQDEADKSHQIEMVLP